MVRTYSELIRLPTWEERYAYLRMRSAVGEIASGHDRYLAQMFYRSPIWRNLRHEIIIRDGGCDLAMPGYEIRSMVVIHHMNQLRSVDVENMTDKLLDPEGLIATSHETHMMIHYASQNPLPSPLLERTPNDQAPWR